MDVVSLDDNKFKWVCAEKIEYLKAIQAQIFAQAIRFIYYEIHDVIVCNAMGDE